MVKENTYVNKVSTSVDGNKELEKDTAHSFLKTVKPSKMYGSTMFGNTQELISRKASSKS
jgi:hypothetical protein